MGKITRQELSGILNSELDSLNNEIDNIGLSLAEIAKGQDNERKPLITFVCDDGYLEDLNIVAPKLAQYGWSGVCAIIGKLISNPASGYMTKEQIHQIQNTYGWEVASHTVNHVDLTTVSLEQAEIELRQSKELLNAEGYNVENFVYPIGGYNKDIVNITKKYYTCAPITTDGYNYPPINTFKLYRMNFDGAIDGTIHTLDFFKNAIDKAYNEKLWLIIMIHGSGFKTNTTASVQLFHDIADYVYSKGINAVTLKEGNRIFGNSIEIGTDVGDMFKLSQFGDIDSKKLPICRNNNVNVNTPMTSFEIGKITISDFVNADASGFPDGGSGNLLTFRTNTAYDGCNYQVWQSYTTKHISYKRFWNKEGSAWFPWKNYTDDAHIPDLIHVIKIPVTAANFSTPITSFTTGKITHQTFLITDNSGFPGGAGTLETNRLNENDTVNFQKWKPYNSDTVYMRRWTGTAWGTLVEYHPVIQRIITIPDTTLQPSICTDITFEFAEAKRTKGTIVGSPLYTPNDGLMYNIFCKTDGYITIRMINFTGSAYIVQKAWNVTYIME